MGREYKCSSIDTALDILARPDQFITQNWLIIFDNTDDPSIDLKNYFPLCEHGSILITTRNLMLSNLSYRRHLEINVMSPQEAVSTLLITAFAQGETPGDRDKAEALIIVERLGYLPVAITQAGCYIRQQGCLHDYVNRLKANRRKVLERPTRIHRDNLHYPHSVYAAFDTTLDVLSTRARDLLRIISTVHFANFPIPLIGVAAKKEFTFEPRDLLDRPPDFKETISFLKETFCPGGKWDEDQISDLLEELQQYSLVAIVASSSISTLRFHPLVHSWAYDRLTENEEKFYQAAAVRLISCGTDNINVPLFDYLLAHIYSLSSIWKNLHVNDRAGIASIIRYDGKTDTFFELTKGICEEVEETAGKQSIRATIARLDLADAFGGIGDQRLMEEIEREVVKIRQSMLGRDDLLTIEAIFNLANTLAEDNRLEEALVMYEEVLKNRKERLGMDHQDTAHAMVTLSQTYHNLGRYSEEEALLISARDIRAKGIGQDHPWTISVLANLANCYTSQSHHGKAEAIQKEVLHLRTKQLGFRHIKTIDTMEWMCRSYYNQRKFAEAEKLGKQALILRREIGNSRDEDTAGWINWLAQLYHDMGNFADTKRLLEEEIDLRKQILGGENISVHNAISWLVSTLHNLGEYQGQEKLAKQLLSSRTALLGERHVQTLNTKGWLALAYHELGKHKEAEILRKEEWETRCEVQGEQSIDALGALGWLARAHHEQGHYANAETLRKKEIALRTETLGAQHHTTLNAVLGLIETYSEQRRFPEMVKAAEELLEGRRKLYTDDQPEVFDAIQWLGRAYFYDKKYQLACPLWEDIVRRRRSSLGYTHAKTLDATKHLSRIYHEIGWYNDVLQIRTQEFSSQSEGQGSRHEDPLSVL
jgi:tetratricopeptide (TPR) repeat protein